LPIVVVTSNAERALPDAFLRRCVYHYMQFPDAEMLQEIVYARVSSIQSPSRLVRDSVSIVQRLRSSNLRKSPGTAELLAFVLALRARGVGQNDDLTALADWTSTALTTLVKTQQDTDLARQALSPNADDPVAKA
jgi:MoxR-like ATPase